MIDRSLRAFVFAGSLILVAGCTRTEPAPPATAPTAKTALVVSVEPVKSESVDRSVSVLGTLFGDEEATISNKVAGRVRRVQADMGDVVKGGSLLCELELEDFQLAETAARRSLEAILVRLGATQLPDDRFDLDTVATVARALAEWKNAEERLARLRALAAKGPGFVAEQTLQDAETSAAVAKASVEAERVMARALVAEARQRQAELEIARRRLHDARIQAPEGERAWSVTARLVSEGEYVKDGTALYRVVISDPLKLRAAVPERYSAVFKVGEETKVRVEAWGERVFPGKVSRVNPWVDPANRTFGVEVLVPNGDGALRPGSFGRGEVFIGREDALFVPEDAIVSFAGTTKLFVVKDGKARAVVVQTGERRQGRIEVRGIAAGDEVATRGHSALSDGAAVTIEAKAIEAKK